MSETTPPTDPTSTDPTQPAPKKKRKLWKWLLGGVVVIVLLIGLLVLLAPTIISTGAVRGMVVSKVNENLNGKVEIQDWKITWTGGVKVEGIRVFDAANAQIAEVKTLSTELSLLDAAKGKIALGKTVADGVNFNLKKDSNGKYNFANLPKADPSGPKTEKPADPKPAGEPAKLPELSGDIAFTNISGTIEEPGQPTLHITNLNGGAVIKSLNVPIDHNLDVALKVQDKSAGKIALKGSASLKDQDINNLNVNDTLTLEGIDLQGLRALIPASAGVDLNRGVTDGTITLVVADGKSAALNGTITGKDYEIAGQALKGDKFVTRQLNVTLTQLEIAMPNGPTDTTAMVVKTGGEKGTAVTVSWDQGSVSLVANTPLSALMNLAANKAPGAGGKVNVDVQIDVAATAKVLPNTLSIPKEVSLTSGKLSERIDITLQPEQAVFSVVTDVKEVAGTNNGKPVSLKPINVTLTGNARGSDQKLPDLRNLVLSLTSGFANAKFEAPTITQLAGEAKADLKALQDELGQIVDFKGKTLAGTFVMNVSTKGDPQKLSTPAPADVKVSLTNIAVTGVAKDPIRVENLVATVKSTLNATDAGALQSIDNTVITVQNLRGQEATIDALIEGVKVTLGDTMKAVFKVSRLNLNVEKLQDDLKPFVEALQKGGRLDIGRIDIALAGEVTQTADTMTANLKDLSVTETKGLFSLAQPKDSVITVKQVTPKEGPGTLEANGKLNLAADFKRGQAVAKEFNKQATVNGKQTEVTSGKLDGTLELATLDPKNLKVTGDFKISDLSIDTGKGETARQQITLALTSTAATDFTAVKDTNVTLGAPFGDVKLENFSVDLPPAPPKDSKGVALPVVKSGTLTADFKDMGPLDSLRSALAPAAPPPATQPVRVPRGAAKLVANIKQVGQEIVLDVTELSGTEDLRLQQGDGIYKVKAFNNKDPLQVRVTLTGKSAQPLAEQITKINVSKLDLKLGVATIKSEKLIIDKPLSAQPVPDGNVVISGKIQDVTEIPEMLAKKKKGELYPYEGDYLVTQKFNKTGDTVVVDGNIGVTNLVVYQDGKPYITEPQVTIVNNLGADLAGKNLTITKLLIDMPQSKAINVAVTGGVKDWEKQRVLDKIVVKLAGDWEKLWTIAKPLVPKDSQEMVKDLTLAGKFDRQIDVGGSMPSGVEGPAATRLITAQGSIGIEKLIWPSYGVTEATNIEVPFTLKENLLTTAIPGQAYTPMKVNGGTVNIHNFRYAIADPPRLYIDPGTQVMKGVSLTAAMTEKLGDLFKNPLFLESKESSGTIDLTILECNRFPASGIAMQKVPANDGTLKIIYSINDFKTLNEFTTLFAQLVDKDQEHAGNDLRGSIKDAAVTLQGGEVVQDTTLLLGQRQTPIRFTGGVNLESLNLKNFIMNLPPTMLKQVTKDKNIAKYLPTGINVALRGPASKPQFDLGNSIQTMIRDATLKAGQDQLLGGLGGKKEEPAQNPGDNQTKPEDKPKDPIGGALDDLFGKKKKDDKKKK